MTKQGRSPALYPPIAKRDLKVSKEDTFELRKITPTKGLFLLRHYLTRLLLRGETLDRNEEAALHLLFLWMESVKDVQFFSKNAMTWLGLKLLKELIQASNADTSWGRASIRRLQISNPKLFVSPRALAGQVIDLEKEVFRRINRRFWRRPPPLAFIGVGYRDKGNARQHHQDGSPSWQEVASATLSVPEKRPLVPLGNNGLIDLSALLSQHHLRYLDS